MRGEGWSNGARRRWRAEVLEDEERKDKNEDTLP